MEPVATIVRRARYLAAPGLLPVSFAVTRISEAAYTCALGVVSGLFLEATLAQ